APPPGSLSAAPAQPVPDHVGTLSSFLSQLRAASYGEKQRMEKAESAAQEVLGLKSGSSSALSLPPLPPLPTLITQTPVIAAAGGTAATTTASTAASAASAATNAATNATTNAATNAASAAAPAAPEVNSLAGLALKAFPGLTGSGNTSAASIAGAAAQAAPSLFGSGLKGMTSQDLQAALAPMAQKFGIQLPALNSAASQSGAQAAAAATGAAAAATGAGATADGLGSQALTGLQSAYQRIGTLEEQNRQLANQLKEAQQALNELKQPAVTTGSAPYAPPASTLSPASADADFPLKPEAAPSVLPDVSPEPSPAPPFQRLDNTSTAPTSTQENGQPKDILPLKAVPGVLNPQSGAVKFELEGVTPSWSDIKLKVVLHNNKSMPLALPPNLKAVVHMDGKPDRTVSVSFPSRQIAANSAAHGTIRIPGHDINASADVYLPNFLPPSEAYRDVHLSVPISKL
ncbi:MAG TPA: hypothetical protein V6D17_05800, partial [Candidatus Obscuribacterales bacterium]